LLKKFNSPIISLSINIPGSNKLTNDAKYIFDVAMDEIKKLNLKIKKVQTLKAVSGYEAQISVDDDAIKIKRRVTKIEQSHFLGRFMDIDVIGIDEKQISREDISMAERKCFICQNSAKICARSKRHTLDELLLFIQAKVEQYDRS